MNHKSKRTISEKSENDFRELRELFIRRMTVDSSCTDRRRSEFNQAIFSYESDDDVDAWNKDCEKFGLSKKKYGRTYPVWDEIDMSMVLQCFDNAVKDYKNIKKGKEENNNG